MATNSTAVPDNRPARLYDGDTFTRDGETYRVEFPHDETHPEPWKDGDGRGVVTESRRTDEGHGAGERLIHEDHGWALYYNVRATLARAIREGWDAPPYTGTKRQRAARAVEVDFERMRGWCADEWQYIGVVVERLDRDGRPTGDRESVWGIESDAGAYLVETAWDLAAEIAPTEPCATCKGSGRVPRAEGSI